MASHKLSDQVTEARSLLARLADAVESDEGAFVFEIVDAIDEVRAILSDVQEGLKTVA